MHQACAHSTAFSGVSKGDSAPSSLVRRRLAHRALTRHALALCYACSQCVLPSCSARSSASMFAAPLNDSFVASLIAAATSPPPTTSTPPLSRQQQHRLQAVGTLLIHLRETVDLVLEASISRPSLGRRSFVRMPAADTGLYTLRANATTIIQGRGGLEKATWTLKRLPSPFAAPAESRDIDGGGGQSSEGISAAMTRPATPQERSRSRELVSGNCAWRQLPFTCD